MDSEDDFCRESRPRGRERAISTKASCTLSRTSIGIWYAHHSGSEFGTVEVSASNLEDAPTKIRNELQYRIELCPCSGVSGDSVHLQVTEAE
jgi:hypothetical protein